MGLHQLRGLQQLKEEFVQVVSLTFATDKASKVYVIINQSLCNYLCATICSNMHCIYIAIHISAHNVFSVCKSIMYNVHVATHLVLSTCVIILYGTIYVYTLYSTSICV